MIDVQRLESAIQAWLNFKADFLSRSGTPNQGDIKEFTERANHASSEAMQAIGSTDPKYLEGVGELFTHASVHVRMPEFLQ